MAFTVKTREQLMSERDESRLLLCDAPFYIVGPGEARQPHRCRFRAKYVLTYADPEAALRQPPDVVAYSCGVHRNTLERRSWGALLRGWAWLQCQ